MLPLLGAALGAGIGGVQNWMAGKQREKDEKKEAMRELYNRYMAHGNMRQIGKAPYEAPSMAESVGLPILGAGISELTKSDKQKAEEEEEGVDWYQQAAKGYLGAVR